VESVVSASLIVLVIRSRKPFFKSRPGTHLFMATLSIVAATLILPFTPLARIFGFGPLPILFLLLIGTVVLGYVVAAEVGKKVFYHRVRM
jgi:Mg2+-importing ATPase